MSRQLAAFGDLHLGVRAAASTGPGHDVVALVDLASLEAFLEERPDGLVVLGGEREVAAAPFRIAQPFDQLVRLAFFLLARRSGEVDFVVAAHLFGEQPQLVRIVPVHPVSEPYGLLGLPRGELEHPAFALVDEVVDAVLVDGGLRAQTQLLFDFDFDPQTLAIEPVLVALVVTHHGEESLIGVFVSAAPGVVDAHRIVGRDRAVEEAPAFPASVLLTQLPED